MTEQGFYIWIGEICGGTVRTSDKCLAELGAFPTVAEARQKIDQLKNTSEYKEMVLLITDRHGFMVL